MLKLENISKAWVGFELKNINLTIQDGEYSIILGPTGSGKTLLLETIMGFHLPDQGRILKDDTNITKKLPEKKRIGYVSQNSLLFPHLNVRQNVEFGLKMQGKDQDTRRKISNKILEKTGLIHLEKRKPATLSGGEAQKVAIARAIAPDPDTLLLDEPLTGLDPQSSKELKQMLKSINQEGKTMLHVTHNQIEAFSLGKKMSILKEGQIIQTGSTKDIFLYPKNEFVAKFLGYENIFKAKVEQKIGFYSGISTNGVKMKITAKPETPNITIAIRPEDIILSSKQNDQQLNNIEAVVTDFSDQGPMVEIELDANIKIKAMITKSNFIQNNFKPSQKVWVSIIPSSVKILE